MRNPPAGSTDELKPTRRPELRAVSSTWTYRRAKINTERPAAIQRSPELLFKSTDCTPAARKTPPAAAGYGGSTVPAGVHGPQRRMRQTASSEPPKAPYSATAPSP